MGALLASRIGGYNHYLLRLQVDNYPGATSIGSITTVMIITNLNTNHASSISSLVKIINPVMGVADGLVSNPLQQTAVSNASLIKWTAPSTSIVDVLANASNSPNGSQTTGIGSVTMPYV